MNYDHDSISSIYNQITNANSLNQTVKSKEYLVGLVRPDTSALELGCGNGILGISLAKKGLSVTGLDLSKKMITNAKKRSKEEGLTNIRFEVTDLLSYDTDEKFDYVVLPYILNVFPDEQSVSEVVKKAISHLKPGGHLLIADEMRPKNALLSICVNILRIPVFMFFMITTGMSYHKIHDLKNIMEKLNIEIIEEKRFLFQYCSVIVGKV
jgi:2-polyprenyl-3-methyl-5-hydroxy-6-metoxy-1,4-benzoquinol methylase